MRALSTYRRLVAANLTAELRHGPSALVGLVMSFGFQLTGLLFLWVVLDRSGGLGGWTKGEVTFLYGLRLLVRGLSLLVFGRLDGLPGLVHSGGFDRYLVRPLPPLLQVMAARVSLNALGDVVGGVTIFLLGNTLVRFSWSPTDLAYLVLVILGGCLLEPALRLIVASLSFWFVGTGRLLFVVDDLFNSAGNYPLSIFDGAIQLVFTLAVPVALVASVPATVLLARTPELGVQPLVAQAVPFAGLIWFVTAHRVWQRALRSYQSTGH